MTVAYQLKFGCLLTLLQLGFVSQAQYSLGNFDLDGEIYQWYDAAIGVENAGLVLGEYQGVSRISRDSHQFFGEDTWKEGSINYRGEVFDSVYLLYDIYGDVMVMRHPNLMYQAMPVKPIQSQVSWFTLNGHLFKYYNRNILHFKPGFFDLLYPGQAFELLAKRIKDSRAESSLIFVTSDVFIVRLQDEYHRLRRRGSVLRLFKEDKERKRRIRQFIKSNGLQINSDSEQDLIELARFCDELLSDQ